MTLTKKYNCMANSPLQTTKLKKMHREGKKKPKKKSLSGQEGCGFFPPMFCRHTGHMVKPASQHDRQKLWPHGETLQSLLDVVQIIHLSDTYSC